MIFVTVGEQLPFDRLICTVDEYALTLKQNIFAQIGETPKIPNNIEYKNFLDPGEFKEIFKKADLIVAHAGMGTIITALEQEKPIIVMPRQASLGEHRNDHQFATAKRFLKLNYISVAFDEDELRKKLKKLNHVGELRKIVSKIDPAPLLIKTIKNFIHK